MYIFTHMLFQTPRKKITKINQGRWDLHLISKVILMGKKIFMRCVLFHDFMTSKKKKTSFLASIKESKFESTVFTLFNKSTKLTE